MHGCRDSRTRWAQTAGRYGADHHCADSLGRRRWTEDALAEPEACPGRSGPRPRPKSEGPSGEITCRGPCTPPARTGAPPSSLAAFSFIAPSLSSAPWASFSKGPSRSAGRGRTLRGRVRVVRRGWSISRARACALPCPPASAGTSAACVEGISRGRADPRGAASREDTRTANGIPTAFEFSPADARSARPIARTPSGMHPGLLRNPP